MGKEKKKSDERLAKIVLITALISLLEKLLEVIIRLLEIVGGGYSPSGSSS